VFSSRLNWDLRPNPLSTLLEQKRAEGAHVIDLTESNPTRAGFTYPTEEILSALADPLALHYDPSPRGLASAREAISNYYAHRGAGRGAGDLVTCRPDQILLTASTSEAYAYLFKLLCDPGDEILAPRPSYPLFEFLAALESVRIRQYPLRYDGAWHIDFPSLEAAITSRTRAIIVVNPNNPTGSFLKPDEFDRLQSLAIAPPSNPTRQISEPRLSRSGTQAPPSPPHSYENRSLTRQDWDAEAAVHTEPNPTRQGGDTERAIHSPSPNRQLLSEPRPSGLSEPRPSGLSEPRPSGSGTQITPSPPHSYENRSPTREGGGTTAAVHTEPNPTRQGGDAKTGIAILMDEVFSDYHFGAPPPTPAEPHDWQATRSPTPPALTFSMSGLSKIAGLPQMKLGWIVAQGPGHQAALDRLELVADTYLSVATPIQLALPRLLAASEIIRAQILDRAQSNLARLRSLTAGTACHVLNVEGGWSATLQVPRTRTEESWALTLLADHDVLVQPGFFFDFESEAFLVVSLITPPELFDEGIRRLLVLTSRD
jgi:aspartate/methionine/tyrosine aminotransferase